MKSVPSNFSILEPLLSSPAITSTITLALIPLVGFQIILSQILAIQNNNHTQNTNIYMENPFSLKGKITRQTPNNFIIVKSITIILVYASRLKKKKKPLLFFFALTHINYLSQMRQSFFSILQYATPCFFFFFSLCGPYKNLINLIYITLPPNQPCSTQTPIQTQIGS